MKRTEFLPGDIKPVRTGVYERDFRQSRGVNRNIGIAYCYWDGKRWAIFDITPERAESCKHLESSCQQLPWRGLASNPESTSK